MKKINDYLNSLGLGWLFKVSVIVSIAMLIAGFLVPPMGVIDGTVLVAVGEMGIIVNIPVFFALGAPRPYSEEVLNKIEDCKAEIDRLINGKFA